MKEEGPSLIKELANQGSIERGVVGLFVSRFDDKPHSIQIGDYDTSLIQGGENSLRWFNLSLGDEGDAWRWETDLTKSHFGQHVLFKHDMRWVELNAGYAGIGLTTADFKKVSDILVEADPAQTVCNGKRCLTKDKCENHKGKIPDLHLSISNQAHYVIKGDDLLVDKSIVDHTGEYLCEI